MMEGAEGAALAGVGAAVPAIGIALGGINMAMGMAKSRQQKKISKRMAALQAERDKYQYEAGVRDLGKREEDLRHQDAFDVRAINESAADRGVLDSSIVGDDQAERQYQLDRRLGALNDTRADLRFAFMSSEKARKLGRKSEDSMRTLDMLSQFINAGAMGVAQGGNL